MKDGAALKIAVIPNLAKPEARACTDEVVDQLIQCGCEPVVKEDLFDEHGIYQKRPDERLSHCELFIAVGGDGTIIHAAKLAAFMDKPILGINAGNLGFTAGVEREELYLLPNLLKGEYQEENRCMIQVRLISDESERTFQVLNDAVVSGDPAKIIDYQMAVGNNPGYHYRADGFILSTPTGSTAYSLSAGGPVLEPTMSCLLYTPICPHSLFNRSVVFRENTILTVKVSENSNRSSFSADGDSPIELQSKDTLIFSRSNRFVRFIRLNKRDFYDSFYQKIIGSKGT